jgi:hypothetical protein
VRLLLLLLRAVSRLCVCCAMVAVTSTAPAAPVLLHNTQLPALTLSTRRPSAVPPPPPPLSQGELTVLLREGRNLPVWGLPWQSNPWCRLVLGEQAVSSRRDNDTGQPGRHRSPVWNQEVQFLVEDPDKQVGRCTAGAWGGGGALGG